VTADRSAILVEELAVGAARQGRPRLPLVEDVELVVRPREVSGIVGETGAGKTLTVKALLGLLPAGTSATGRIVLGESGSWDLSAPQELRRLRGRDLGVVLQNPVGMFDPLVRVRHQLTEGVVRRRVMRKRQALERARELLASMGFGDAEAVLELFPHQLSGGMAQRVAIAMALMPHPRVVVADEPTSALDAHLRVEALELLRHVAREQDAAVLLVSHDLGLVSHFCDSITVMYAGRVVERGATAAVLGRSQHPYTRALLECSPALDAIPHSSLPTIPGAPPPPGAWPPACVFEPRCPLAFARCREERPALRSDGGRAAACHLAFEAVG
jgi:oligopeptide/dipeptide ABC transporter ATP-binding protein